MTIVGLFMASLRLYIYIYDVLSILVALLVSTARTCIVNQFCPFVLYRLEYQVHRITMDSRIGFFFLFHVLGKVSVWKSSCKSYVGKWAICVLVLLIQIQKYCVNLYMYRKHTLHLSICCVPFLFSEISIPFLYCYRWCMVSVF